jgi:hypothetical protein
MHGIYWPEIFEYDILRAKLRKKEAEESCDEEGARERLARVITPMSMYWDMFSVREIVEMQPDEKKRGWPPYFFNL